MTGEDVEYQPFPKLTAAFVAGRLRPGWKDLLWVARHHWLDVAAISEFADSLAGEDVRADVGVAAMDGDEDALLKLLEREAAQDDTSNDLVCDRWLRVLLAWLYEHRGLYADPWAILEEVWEAFGHAELLSGLIRWMPTPPGGAPGEAGMLERWRQLAASQ
jgi:hypothetical protein